MAILKGWRYAALIGGLVGSIGIAIYPIIIDPMLNPDKYKKIQAVTRAHIRQEDIQPGRKLLSQSPYGPSGRRYTDMKVWTDPFDRKKA